LSRAIHESSIKEADSQESYVKQEVDKKESGSKELGGQEGRQTIQATFLQAKGCAQPVDVTDGSPTDAWRAHGLRDWPIQPRHDTQGRAHAEPV
jgi:hypothetical protein